MSYRLREIVSNDRNTRVKWFSSKSLQLQLTLPVEAIERYWNQNEWKTHESEYSAVRLMSVMNERTTEKDRKNIVFSVYGQKLSRTHTHIGIKAADVRGKIREKSYWSAGIKREIERDRECETGKKLPMGHGEYMYSLWWSLIHSLLHICMHSMGWHSITTFDAMHTHSHSATSRFPTLCLSSSPSVFVYLSVCCVECR